MKTSKFKIRAMANRPQPALKNLQSSDVKNDTTTEKGRMVKGQTMIYQNGLQQSYYPPAYLEPRDRHILVDSHCQDEFDEQAMQKWMGSICRDVVSSSFNSYISGQMTYQQSEIYCCQQILGNIAAMTQKTQVRPQFFEKIDTILKQKILPYLSMKYPLSESTDIYRNLNKVVKQINNIEVLSNDFLFNSSIIFQYRQNANYTDLIMQVVNELISSTDDTTNDGQNEGETNNYYDFTEYMTNLFQKVYDFRWISQRVKLMRVSTIRLSKEEQNNKQEEDSLQNLRYKQKVQQYTHYEIGRKIPESVAKYNEQQIANGFMQIRSPQILRILTKWCEQLWQKFENESYYIERAEGISMTRSKQINIIYQWLKTDLRIQFQQQKIAILQYMKDVQTNLYQQQFKIIYSQLLSKESPFLQRYERICGKFAVKVVRNLQNCIIIYLNRLIHGLMKIAKNLYSRMDSMPSWPFPLNLLSLKIGDLIRCRIFSKQNEIKAIYELLQLISEKQPEKLRIIRVKNRLKLGTNDILINVRYNNSITAEIQLKVKAQKAQTEFSKCSFNFSHFIYEMSRSQFGPISEMCSIWTNLQRRSKIYQQLVNTQNLTHKNSLQKESYCVRNSVPHSMAAITNNPFICNSCGKSYSNDNFILPHTTCKNCSFYVCALCYINQAKAIELIQQLIEDPQLTTHLREQRCSKIPILGVMIPIRSRIRYVIRFKIIEILGKKYVFKSSGTQQFQLIIELKNEKEISFFLKAHLVFEFFSKEPEQFIPLTVSLALKQHILPNYVKNCYKTKRQTISLTKLCNIVLSPHDFEKILAGPKQSRSCIKHFQASNHSLEDISFLNEDFCNLEFINLNINKIKNLDTLAKFKKLNSLFLLSNSINTFPIELCCLSLRYLNVASNSISSIPDELEKISTLEILRVNTNKLNELPIALTRLPNLRELYAYGNKISLLPAEIGNCSKLQILQIQINSLSTLPSSMENLEALQKLDISTNILQKIQLNLANLKKLKEFCFRSNRLKSLPQNSPTIFCHQFYANFNQTIEKVDFSLIHMPNLKILSLQACNLTTFAATDTISSVAQLNLNNNNIQILPGCLANLQNLRVLYLRRSKVCSIDEICRMRSLRQLYLQGNAELVLTQKISLLKLQTLNLSNCRLKQLPASVCKIRTLKNLYIQQSSLVELNSDIQNLKQLSILDISNNQIAELPSEINSLPNLKTFKYSQLKQVNIKNILPTIFKLELKNISLNKFNLQSLPDDIHVNKNIMELNLEWNLFKEVSLMLIRLPNLTSLNLACNQIRLVGDHLFSLVNLTHLNLSNNLIEDLPNKFDKLKKLMTLNIGFNKLKQILTSFESILLNGCKIYYNNNVIKTEPLWFVVCNLQNEVMSLEGHKLRKLPNFTNRHKYNNINLEDNEFEQIPRQLDIFKITTLNLNRNKIKIIPQWFAKFQSLSKLYFNFNLIQQIPSLISTFKKLVQMSIIGNPIKKIDPSLSNIYFKKFSLSASTIDALALESNIGAIQSQQLNIQEEEKIEITENIGLLKHDLINIRSETAEILQKEIGLIIQLKELNIEMPIKKIPSQISALEKLLKLSIKSNLIKDFPVQVLKIKQLRWLKITDSLIQNIPEQISQLSNLRNLVFSRNRLRVLPQNMRQLSSLIEINLQRNLLTEIPQCLENLRINSMNLSFNKIEVVRDGLQRFKCEKNTVYLQGNPIIKVEDANAMRTFCSEATVKQFQHLIRLQEAK